LLGLFSLFQYTDFMKFVLFGATGDLAQKKILPAIARLKAQGENIDVIEVSRRSQVAIDVDAGTGYEQLVAKLATVEPSQVAIYLSLAPKFHSKAVEALGLLGLLVRGKTKLLVEKPFGTNEVSARTLDALIQQYLDETDVYRIDHYLSKAGAQELINRFKNSGVLAEIRVRLFETRGIEGRGASYDGVGAFSDVGQNHLLEMAAVVLAGANAARAGTLILDWQEARARVIQELVPPESTCQNFRRGQYSGYLKEPGVRPDSQTETAFHVETMVDRVHIVLEAGKRMLQAEALIEVIYVDGTRKKIDLNAGSDAYQTMIAAALRGSRREFVGREEVFALWRYADHAAKCWDEVPLEIYGAVDGVDKPFLIQ